MFMTVHPLWEPLRGVATIPAYEVPYVWVSEPRGGLSDGHSYQHLVTTEKRLRNRPAASL